MNATVEGPIPAQHVAGSRLPRCPRLSSRRGVRPAEKGMRQEGRRSQCFCYAGPCKQLALEKRLVEEGSELEPVDRCHGFFSRSGLIEVFFRDSGFKFLHKELSPLGST